MSEEVKQEVVEVSPYNIFKERFAAEMTELVAAEYDPRFEELAAKYGAEWKPDWRINGMRGFRCGAMDLMAPLKVEIDNRDEPTSVIDDLDPKLKARRSLITQIDDIAALTEDSETELRREMLTMYFASKIMNQILVTDISIDSPKCKIYICMNIGSYVNDLIAHYIQENYGINVKDAEAVQKKYHALFFSAKDCELYNIRQRGKDEFGRKNKELEDYYEWYHLQARNYEDSNAKPLTAADQKRFVKAEGIDPRFKELFFRKVQESPAYNLLTREDLRVVEIIKPPKRERY